MIRGIIYFASSGFCIFFSILIIFSEHLLRVSFKLAAIGIYFLLLSLIALCHSIVLTYPDSAYSGTLLVLERIFGLTAGFPLIRLIREINGDLIKPKFLAVIYPVMIMLLAVSSVDLVFGLELLFHIEPGFYRVQPLFKFVYIPFSFIGLGALTFLTFRASRHIQGKYRKIVSTFSIGMICLLPFEYWDLANALIYKNLLDNNIYVFNVGVFLFAIFISSFIIQSIRLHLHNNRPEPLPPAISGGDNGELDVLHQIYNKTVRIIREKRMYADENARIEIVAEITKEPPKDISRAVNQLYGANYVTFINAFRIEEMKRRLSDPDDTRSILEIGISVGFNSKTSLNRTFYKFTRLTPKEFRGRSLYKNTERFLPKIMTKNNNP